MSSISEYLKKYYQKENIGVSVAAGIDAKVDNFPRENKYINKDEFFNTILIDLDGTIHKYSKGFFDGTLYDPPFENAINVMKWLKSKNYRIIIFTARLSGKALEISKKSKEEIYQMIEDWLNKFAIPYDGITCEKIPADVYIDDRALRIENGNWDEIKNKLDNL